MDRVYRLAWNLWLVSFFSFIAIHIYFIQSLGSEHYLSKAVTSFTSVASVPKYDVPSWEPQGFSIFEERAVLILFLLIVGLLVTSVYMCTKKALKVGFSLIYYQLVILSVVLLGAIIYTCFSSGLAYA